MIIKKSKQEITIMREAGRILKSVFEQLEPHVTDGVSSGFLDKIARQIIEDANATPSFLGYRGFKYSTCISKNEEIVHGLPTEDKIIYSGDICSIDCGVYYKGYHVDAARTFKVDDVDPIVSKLIDVTQASFFEAIKDVKAGVRMGVISNTIQKYVEDKNLSVIRDLYSHGIGKELHEDPLIPNYGPRSSGVTLESGMTFAIEPMVSTGSYDILTLPDKWTIITRDNSYSAHYENTILIQEDGVEVLTI